MPLAPRALFAGLIDDAVVIGENLRRLPATVESHEVPHTGFDDPVDDLTALGRLAGSAA